MYSIIDIESNGAAYRKESIIEIALFLYDGHEITDQFITLVNPESEISPYVQKLTGITRKMVKTAPKFHEVAKRIIEITQETTLVGHNVDFDYRMLRQSFKRLGYDFKMNTIDTIPMAKQLIPDVESYSLGKLCKSIGIPLVDAHRASGDARATLELFKLLISKDTKNQIIQLHQEEAKAKTYTNKIKELTEDLPAEKGILYFQNEKGNIIYSDLADDIYKVSKRILNSKSSKYLKIQKEVEHISYEFTGTDFIARLMLREKGIKKTVRKPYAIFFDSEKNNYFISKRIPEGFTEVFRFRTFSQAEKILKEIKNNEAFSEFENLKNAISLSKRNELWISKGRVLGEKSFLVIRNGKLIGYGFYELYHQILSWDKISKLMVKISNTSPKIKQDLQFSLFHKEYEVIKLPD